MNEIMDKLLEQRKGLKKKHLPYLAVILILSILGVWMIFGDHSDKYRIDKRLITVSEVIEEDFYSYLRLNGQVHPGSTVKISALESGVVETKLVAEGALVKAGDVIAILKNPNLAQQTLDSEAQLAEKQNMLRDTEINMKKDILAMMQNKLSVTTEANRSKRAYSQQKELYEERLTSRENFLKAEEDYLLAQSQLDLLKERIYQDSLYRNIQLVKMTESLDNMQENLMLIRQRAENLKIRASHDGQLGSFDVELGQSINAGTTIGQINLLDNYMVKVNVDEHYIDKVSTGLMGRLERQNIDYSVNIEKIYPEVRDGKFRCDLCFADGIPENIRIGQTYYINLQLDEPVNSVLISRGGFFSSTGGRWIFVISEDGKEAVKRFIKIGRQNPGFYEVTEGLIPGEKVITSPYDGFANVEKLLLE